MVIFLKENKRDNLGQQFGKAIGGVASSLSKSYVDKLEMDAEDKELKRRGIDVEGLRNPRMREKIFETSFNPKEYREDPEKKFINQLNLEKQKHQSALELQEKKYGFENELAGNKKNEKNRELIQPFESALETINDMRQILGKKNLGVLSKGVGLFHGETRKDRAQYMQLGKSLISMASQITIRNRAEFEELAHDLYNPSNTDEANEGILDAMEQILKRSMSQYQNEGQKNKNAQIVNQNTPNNRPPLSSFKR